MDKRDHETYGKKAFFYHNPILNPLPSYNGNPLIRKELYGNWLLSL